MCTKCYAYTLEDNNRFRYDFLLGAPGIMQPILDDDVYEMTHPEEKPKFIVKSIPTNERTGISKVLTKLAWRLYPRHIGPPHIRLAAARSRQLFSSLSVCKESHAQVVAPPVVHAVQPVPIVRDVPVRWRSNLR